MDSAADTRPQAGGDNDTGPMPSEAMIQSILLSQGHLHQLARRKHLLIALEVNSRATLTDLAQEVRAPISTVFDDLRAIRRDHVFIILRKQPAQPPHPDGLPDGWKAIQRRRHERHERIITALRHDARAPLTRLSRQLDIPISTLANDMAIIKTHVAFSITAKTDGAEHGEAQAQQPAKPAPRRGTHK